MGKLLFTTSSFDLANIRQRARLESAGFELVLNPYGRRLTEAEAKKVLQDKSIVGMVAGVEPLTADVLRTACGLKVIARCGIGMDNVDLEAAREKGIILSNTPGSPTLAVAEFTIAHILALLRRLGEADRAARAGRWKPLMGRLLSEQTVGLLGFGRIGRKVAELLRPFGCRLLAYDTLGATGMPEVKAVDFDELLSAADILSLHVPYGSENHHLINASRLALMKPGAILINVSRGGLVDEAALYDALVSGQLSGAGLDAFEQEPYQGALRELGSVQITAHMGSYAKEARAKMEQEAADNLVAGLEEQGLLPS